MEGKTKYLKYFLILSVLIAFSSHVNARKKTKTVGDILKKIEATKIKKKRNLLPTSSKYKAPKSKVNLKNVKPPASNRFYYKEGTSERELEKITDEQIDHLYGMTQKFGKSSRRGELWIRLAELYVDKAKLIELRLQDEYDQKLKLYSEKKLKRRPKINLKEANNYNRKSIKLYEWFVRDFPKDPKMDQALFFLGYNYFELNQTTKGKEKYKALVKKFPKSPYVDESNFALGEFYFEREKWKDARSHYNKISRNKRSRLYSFSIYKRAWCKYKVGEVKGGLRDLEKVIYEGRKAKGSSGDGKVSRIRLASEAAKDIVVFYPEVYKARNARGYFNKVLGENSTKKMLDKLAFYYVQKGDKSSAKYVFKNLIKEDPFSVRAYEYQHEIVKMYQASGNQKVFKAELFDWIENYGAGSLWRRENKSKTKLISESNTLIESTLRNYILQLHQTAQNSRAKFSQKQAKDGYNMYFTHIKDSKHADQMNFFNGELLYDMKDYVGAAKSYNKVVAIGNKKGKYYKQAILNSVLSLEKKIPNVNEIKTLVGTSKEPVPFPSTMKSFTSSAGRYLKEYPKESNAVAIKYRVSSLYYSFNQYDKALPALMDIVSKHPKDKHAEYSANLVLDIYNKKKDYTGLAKVSSKLLAVSGLSSNIRRKIRDVKGKAGFKLAEQAADGKDPLKAAQSYMDFVKKNPKSDLLAVSKFNAAVNYKKAGKMSEAIKLYTEVMNFPAKTTKDREVKKQARRSLAFLYEQTGQYAKAAGAFEGFAKKYPKDQDAKNYHYNAAVIYDALDFHTSAIRNYEVFQKKSRGAEKNDINYAIASIWDRRKRFPSKAILYYDRFMKGPSENKSAKIKSAYRVSKIHKSLKRRSKTTEWYKKVIYRQKKLGAGASYAAESMINLIEENEFKKFKKYKISTNAAKMASSVKTKLALLNTLKAKLKKVVAYDDPYQIVAALTLQGEALDSMAKSIYAVPIPKQLKGDQIKQYKAGIEGIAGPYKKEAIETLSVAVKKAYELQVYDANVKRALDSLDKIQNTSGMMSEMKVLKSLWLSKAGVL